MSKVPTLKTRTEFAAVYERGRRWQGRRLAIKVAPNGLGFARFGYSVGKEVGNAVLRNRVRRRLKAITSGLSVGTGWDVVVMARQGAGGLSYSDLKDEVTGLGNRAKLFDESEGVGPRTD
jgi:ribonuclease P protein component